MALNDAMLASQLFHQKPWRPHLHAKGFDFIAPCHRTTVVVRQHHHRHVGQPGIKGALATHIEVVHIHQAEQGRVWMVPVAGSHDELLPQADRQTKQRRTTPTTTPHISS